MALKIGVVLFKDASPFSRDGNIACAYGEKPFFFNATTDLPSQTLWVTNAASNALYEAGLSRSPHIANDGYFRSRLSQIAQELGLTNESIGIEQQVKIMAEVLGCAADMLKTQLGLTQYPAYGMPQAVGQIYGGVEPPRNSLTHNVAELACQRFTACERQRMYERAEVFSYWAPRMTWANEMLELPLPDGHVELLAKHKLPDLGRNATSIVDWAYGREAPLPLFAKIRLHGIEERVGRLMNYGAGALGVTSQTNSGQPYDARNFRDWTALPELAFLSNYGEVEILDVAIADRWQNTGLRTFKTKHSSVSYAYGIAAENLWVGTLRKNSGRFNISTTLSTAWLQAEDRMRCLKIALNLQKAGMEISNYGNGRISVICPQSVRGLIPQAALENGLLYPASLEGLTPYPASSKNALCVQQRLITDREYLTNIRIDRECKNQLESVYAPKRPAN
jgi:hypothetical protein